jgi:hypothetical protein
MWVTDFALVGREKPHWVRLFDDAFAEAEKVSWAAHL